MEPVDEGEFENEIDLDLDRPPSPIQPRLIVTNEGLLDPSLLVRTEGYLYKKGGAVNARGGFKTWKKRWFAIEPAEVLGHQGYELKYYDGPNGRLKGTVGLTEVELYCESRSVEKKIKFEFQILLENGGVLELSCDDAKEREEWIETLTMEIAFLKKMLTSNSITLDGYDPVLDDDAETYQIGEEIAQNCQAYGPGLFGSEAGQPVQFIIQIHDRMGQLVNRGAMPIAVTITNSESIYYIKVRDNNDGTYLVSYTIGVKGKYSLSIKLNDEHHIFGSPFDIEILPSRTLAKLCYAEGEMLTKIKANSVERFTIFGVDSFGNLKNRGGDPFEVGVMGPANLLNITDNGNGTYTCEIEAQNPMSVSYVSAAALMLLVTLNGKPIKGSPFRPIIYNDTNNVINNVIINDKSGVIGSRNPSFHSDNHTSNDFNNMLRTPNNYTESINYEKQPLNLPSNPLTTTTSIPANSMIQQQNTLPNRSNSILNNNNNNNSLSSTTPINNNISKLERARLLALKAKSLTENSSSVPVNPPSQESTQTNELNLKKMGQNLRSSISIPRSGVLDGPNSPTNNNLSMTGTNNNNNNNSTGLSKLSQIAARNANALNALKQTKANLNNSVVDDVSIQASPRTTGQQASLPPEEIAMIVSSLRVGLGGPLEIDNNQSDSQSQQHQKFLWDQTHNAFSNQQVISSLANSCSILKSLFDLYAENIDGNYGLKFTNSFGGGVVKVLELYDVIPTYVSKAEAKVIFNLISNAQKKLRASSSIPNGNNATTGLDFICFIKYLVMTVIHSLLKTNSLSNVYTTIESKVEVLLFQWGFGDNVKFQVVNNNMNNRTLFTPTIANNNNKNNLIY
eukprot:gene7045-9620_t